MEQNMKLKQNVAEKLVVTVEFVTVTRHRNWVLEWVWKGGNSARLCNIYPPDFNCFLFVLKGGNRGTGEWSIYTHISSCNFYSIFHCNALPEYKDRCEKCRLNIEDILSVTQDRINNSERGNV